MSKRFARLFICLAASVLAVSARADLPGPLVDTAWLAAHRDEVAVVDVRYIAAAQAQKHVTHNEALDRLDGLVQLSVKDRDLTAPPASPAEGDRYIVASGATAAWAGWDGDVALFSGGTWVRLALQSGWRVWIEDEAVLLVFDGAGWVGITPDALQNLTRLGLGTSADAANPFSAKLNGALWTALTTG